MSSSSSSSVSLDSIAVERIGVGGSQSSTHHHGHAHSHGSCAHSHSHGSGHQHDDGHVHDDGNISSPSSSSSSSSSSSLPPGPPLSLNPSAVPTPPVGPRKKTLLHYWVQLWPMLSTQATGPPEHVRRTVNEQRKKRLDRLNGVTSTGESVSEAMRLTTHSPSPSSSPKEGEEDLEKQSLLPPKTSSPIEEFYADLQRDRYHMWCNNDDGCGLFCVGFTWFLLLWPNWMLYSKILLPWESLWSDGNGYIYLLIPQLLTVLSLYSHFRAMTTDPGAIPYGCLPIVPPPESGLYPSCEKCAYNYKPPRAHHCSSCNRCISKMDHHCPWINNCVGVGNLKYFLQFCVFTCLACVYVFTLIFTRIITCPSSNISMCFDTRLASLSDEEYRKHSMSYSEDSAFSFVLVVLLIMECFVFGLFTFAMSISQVNAVSLDETQIESWQKERDAARQKAAAKSNSLLLKRNNSTPKSSPLNGPVNGSSDGSSPSSSSVASSTPSFTRMPTVTIPVAEPLPPTTMTRARNCRMVFVGTANDRMHSATTPSIFSPARYGWLHSPSAKYNPCAWIVRILLIVPNLLFSCATSSFFHYILPTTVRHEDYPRLCHYRLPAPGVQTIIDVVDTSSTESTNRHNNTSIQRNHLNGTSLPSDQMARTNQD